MHDATTKTCCSNTKESRSTPLQRSEQGVHAVHAVKAQSTGHDEEAHETASELRPQGSPPWAARTETSRVRMMVLPPQETGHVLQLQPCMKGHKRALMVMMSMLMLMMTEFNRTAQLKLAIRLFKNEGGLP